MKLLTSFKGMVIVCIILFPSFLIAGNQKKLNNGFVAEQGQFKTFENLKFFWQDEKVNIYFLTNKLVFITEEVTYEDNEESLKAKAEGNDNLALKLSAKTTVYRFDLEFVNSNENVNVLGINQMKHANDYYLGHCPDGILNVLSYEQIKYTDIYDNIDLVFYFNDTVLKYEFIINEGGNPNDIKLNWEGVKDLNIVDNNVSFNIGSYSFTDLAPVSFDAEGNEVKTNYVLSDGLISFDIDTDDSESIQILDPGIVWASSLQYYGYGSWGEVVANSKGDFYYVDWEWTPNSTDVTNYLAAAGSSSTFGSATTGDDIIISKFDQNGTLSWACRYGGSGADDINGGVALDDNDNLFITGTSAKSSSLSSGDFPLQSWSGAFNQAWDGSLSTGTRGYLIKFQTNNARQWATYLDRGANLEVFDISIGLSNTVYMTGKSGGYPTRIKSGSIPTGSGYNGNLNGNTTATSFILEFNSSGALSWSTWLPGSTTSTGTGRACDIAIDNSGNIYVAGDDMWSSSTRFSTSLISASYTNLGDSDLFYMKFNSSHSAVTSYGKYIGGAGFDKINVGAANGDIEVDESGNLYLVGHTYSANFPVTDPGGCAYYDDEISDGTGITANVCGTQDGYLVKVSSSGSISYATFFGGTAYTSMKKIKCDSDGNIWGCGLQNNTGLATVSHTDYYNQTFLGTSGKILLFQLRDDDYLDWLSYFGPSTGSYYYGGFDIQEPDVDNVDLFFAGNFSGLTNVGGGYQYSSSSCTGAVKIRNTLSVHEPDGITPTMADVCNVSQLTVNGSLPSGTSWEWTSGSCGGSSVGSGTTISVAPSTTTTYYVQAVGTCFNSNCINYTVNVYNSGTSVGTWIGDYSTDWNDCRNWGEGRVPDYTVDVTIPSGCTYYPNLTAGHFYINSNSGTYQCKSLTIQSGGTVSTTTASVDVFVDGNLTVQTGGTLSLYDDLDVRSGGNLYVTGGTITNNQNSGAYGDLYFRDGSGGYMSSGSMTFYNEARWYNNTTWYASGGDFHCGGTGDIVNVEIDDNSVYLRNFYVDAGVTAQLVSCDYELDINASCYLYGKMETDGFVTDVEYSTYIYTGGELELNGAGSIWYTDGIYVGTSSSTEGTLDINEGLLQNDVTYIYVYGLVDMDGGTLDNNFYLNVYDGGQYLQNAGIMDTYNDMRIYDGNGTLVDFAGGSSRIGSSASDYCLRIGYGGSGSGETKITGGTVTSDHLRVYSGAVLNMTSGGLGAISSSNFNSGLGNGYGGVDVDGIVNISGGIVQTNADWENWGGTTTFGGTVDVDINGHMYNRPGYNSVFNIEGSATVECGSIPNYQGTINQSGGKIDVLDYYFEQKENYVGGHFYGSGGTIELHGITYLDLDNDDDYFNNVIINGVRDLGDSSDAYAVAFDINGDLTLHGCLFSNGRNIEIAGDWICYGQFSHDNDLVTFDGNALQIVYPGISPFNDILVINTASGINDINVTDQMEVYGNATFTDGVMFYSSSGSLTFGNTASSNVGNSNSYVNGVVTKTGSSLFNFALGDDTEWGPCAIAAPAVSSTISAEYINEAAPYNWATAYMCAESDLHHASGYEYWEMTSNAAYPAVTLYWNTTASGITDLPDVTVAHYTGSCWENMGGVASGNSSAGNITSNVTFSSYSPVTFATKTKDNSLPVEILYFKANCIDGSALLEWQTMSEINNDYFVLEKSNGKDEFVEIARIDVAGNSHEPIEYNYVDENLNNGDNYYRLKQVDYDGKESIFEIISLNCSENGINEPKMTVYPNPFVDELTVNIENINGDFIELQIFDELGKLILSQKYKLNSNSFNTVLQLDELKSAVYNLRCISNDVLLNDKIIRK